jgi:hypothetical protein
MKFGDGIYAYVGKNFKSNTGIILTQDGVVLIDSGHERTDSRTVMEAVKKLTPMPVRFLIDTEPHPDHTTGHFVFASTAKVVSLAFAVTVIDVADTILTMPLGRSWFFGLSAADAIAGERAATSASNEKTRAMFFISAS